MGNRKETPKLSTQDWPEWVNNADRYWKRLQLWLDTETTLNHTLDEMSIYIEPDMMDDFTAWAKTQSVLEHFNSVTDNVHRISYADDNPEPEEFQVRFEFFHVLWPEGRPYRIEVMSILDGFSSVHNAMMSGSVPHASFKVNTREEFWDSVAEVSALDMLSIAAYENSYGMFSYHGVEGEWPHIKPRVNLRDS